MDFNFLTFLGAALVPMVIGFIWYGPLFGKTWMNLMGFTEESLKEANMLVILGMSFVFSFLLAVMLQFIVVHQLGVVGTLMPQGASELSGDSLELYNQIMEKYGNAYRTFKHGALHGAISGLLFATPILSIQAMFERKKTKYILINAGYWMVTLALMGGIVCQWA